MCQHFVWRWKGTTKTKIKKQSEENIIEDLKNIFRPIKEHETIKYRIITDIRDLFEQQYV